MKTEKEMVAESCIQDSYPYRVTNTRCLLGTVISPDDGHIVARKHVEKSNNILRKNCAPSWLHLQYDNFTLNAPTTLYHRASLRHVISKATGRNV